MVARGCYIAVAVLLVLVLVLVAELGVGLWSEVELQVVVGHQF